MTNVLRNRDFRDLWIGQSVSAVGDRMITVALALFVTQSSGGSTSDVGLVLTAYVLPLVVFLPLAGVWADRLPRRGLMIGSDLVRCAMQGALALTIVFGSPAIALVMAFEAVCATAEAFSRPAFTGLLPQTVPEEQIQQANSMVSLSSTAAEFLGPAIATLLITAAKPATVFAVDAATFGVGVLFLLRVRPRPRGVPADREPFMRELMAGLHAVRARPWVWVTLVVFSAAAAIGFAPFFVLGPAVAEQRYDSSTIFGLLVTTMGVGTFAGAILGLRWRPRRPLRTAFLVLFAWPASLAAFAIGAPFGFVLVAMVCGGVAIALFEIWWDTVMMELIPPELLSRVSAWDWLGSVGLFPISYLAFGFLAASISASSLLLIGTVGAALLLVVGLLPEDTRTVESTA